jgi:hypothetical protein
VIGGPDFGAAIAVSPQIAAIAGPTDSNGAGAVWVFNGTSTQKLSAAPYGESGTGFFGLALAFSGDSNTLVIGAPLDSGGAGAAWVFGAVNGNYANGFAEQAELRPSDETGNGKFGSAIGISQTGSNVLIGGPGDNNGAGSAWPFNPAVSGATSSTTTTTSSTTTSARATTVPAVSAISPSTGITSGATIVTLTGTGFTGATAVLFGTTAGSLLSVDSDTKITAASPVSASTGAVNVRVIGPGGTSPKLAADLFTYTKAPPTSSTTTTTRTTTTTSASAKHPVARIVRISMTPVKRVRTLILRIRVSERASAKLVLRVTGTASPLIHTFPVNGGGNTLSEAVPQWIRSGNGKLTVILTDSAGKAATYTTSVKVSA